MSHRTLHLLAALSIAAATATVCFAQDAASTPASGQSAPPSSQTTPASSSTTAKRVWTNDDVGDLREHSAISTSTPANTEPTKPGDRSATTSRNRDAKWYHDQLAKLEARIPPIDRQIANLQAAIDGTPTGDSRTSTRPSGVKGGDWRTEMAQLEAKRDDIAAHIGALQDEARHSGIPAEALP